MSLVVAWSRTNVMACDASAVLQYVLFRLELEGHTTMILASEATEETALVQTADAVVIIADNPDMLRDDFRLRSAPAGAPLFLLLPLQHLAADTATIAGYRSFCASFDIADMRMSDCGVDFVGASKENIRTAIRAITNHLLQRALLYSAC